MYNGENLLHVRYGRVEGELLLDPNLGVTWDMFFGDDGFGTYFIKELFVVKIKNMPSNFYKTNL